MAIVLWIASNAFVAGFSNLARWETGAPYYSMTDLCRWDCGWYGSVARSGYDLAPQRDTGNANWPFHPLFPITVYPFHHWLNLPLGMSLVLASKSALLLAIYGFLLMTGDPTDTTVDRFKAGSLVALNPYVIYAHAGYAEPLYFALLALAFYFVAKGRWIESGVMGALLSATRVVGFLFAVSYAVVWLRDVGWRSILHRDSLNKAYWLPTVSPWVRRCSCCTCTNTLVMPSRKSTTRFPGGSRLAIRLTFSGSASLGTIGFAFGAP